MRTNHLLATLATLILLFCSSHMLSNPRLTVVVVVDGMTQNNLTKLRPYWSAGGLRIMSEEAFQTTITFPHTINGGEETTATLMTGTTPSYHGIMNSSYFSRAQRTHHDILHDDLATGIGTKQQLSPHSILSPTITDDWRIIQGSDAKIYSIGLDSQTTIMLAGHAADACCWLDPVSLKWVTTSSYPDGLPTAADGMNMNGRINELAERLWTPRLDISMYTNPNKDEKRRQFNYLPKDDILHTPTANTLVIELALDMQKTEKLGEDITPDIMLLQLTTISPKANSDIIESAEQEDMYLGINQDLGFLMEQLNRRIGKSNYQILLVGRPIKGYSAQTLATAGIAVQTFNVDRAAALTSTYLMAIYGHERWVDGGYGPFIYLNRTLIEKKRLSLETIQRQVANFLMDFEGVQVAYPIHEAIHSDHRASIYQKHAGDVFFQLHDHWLLYNDDNTPYDRVVLSAPLTPLLFWSGTMTTFPSKNISATDIKSLILNYTL